MSSPKNIDRNYIQLARLVHLMRLEGSFTHYIQAILDGGYDLDYAVPKNSPVKYFEPNWLGNTVLHFAVLSSDKQNSSIVDLLLCRGADFTCKNNNGLTPLLLAFKIGNSTLTNRLLLAHVDSKNAENPHNDKGLSHFHVACYIGNEKVVNYFLQAGVTDDLVTDSNLNHLPRCTPVHLAKRSGNAYVVHLLSQYGAPYSCTLVANGKCPQSPVIIKEIVDRLVDVSLTHDLDVGGQITNDYIKKILAQQTNNQEALELFYISCSKGDFGTVEKFMKSGVDNDLPVDYFAVKYGGYTPIHFAVNGGSEKVIELLLKHGSSITLQDSEGNSPVHLAALKHPRLIELLLRASEFDFKMKNALNQLVFDILFKKMDHRKIFCSGKPEFYDFLHLLRNKSLRSINVVDKINLVGNLFDKFDTDAFESLLNCILDVTDVKPNGCNAIHYIIRRFGHERTDGTRFNNNLKLLVNKGCELDCQDSHGKTPLHYATLFDNEDTAQALLLLGADVNITDDKGKTPYSNCLKIKGCSYARGIIFSHIYALKSAGLQVNDTNDTCYKSINNGAQDVKSMLVKTVDNVPMKLCEFEEVTIIKGLTMRDVLREGIVTKFPMMPKNKRQAILDHIDSLSNDCRQEYLTLVPFFNLQRRRILKSCALFQVALTSLEGIFDFLPHHCLELILMQLSTEDWQNCIEAGKKN